MPREVSFVFLKESVYLRARIEGAGGWLLALLELVLSRLDVLSFIEMATDGGMRDEQRSSRDLRVQVRI